MVIDESHVGVPQLRGMHHGDRSRKEALVEYGFRLPSAFDNRPLTFDEFTAAVGQVLYVSATPAAYELEKAGRRRRRADHPADRASPTPPSRSAPPASRSTTSWRRSGLRAERDERVLVTTLTKRMAEDLTQYYLQMGLRVRYLHSDVDTLERVEVIRDLRLGKFDALIGINLLREGLDIPEVSLVAILDADKEGYLRSATSLVQTSGPRGPERPRRGHHVRGQGHRLDADRPRRDGAAPRDARPRTTPSTASPRSRSGRSIRDVLRSVEERDYYTVEAEAPRRAASSRRRPCAEAVKRIEAEMKDAAKRLDFERAAELRDRLRSLRKRDLSVRD